MKETIGSEIKGIKEISETDKKTHKDRRRRLTIETDQRQIQKVGRYKDKRKIKEKEIREISDIFHFASVTYRSIVQTKKAADKPNSDPIQ